MTGVSDWELTDADWQEAAPDRAATTILVVDDDASTRTMLGFLFEDEGFTVTEAADGAEAIARLRVEPPAVMVLDLMMPNIDGIGVLRVRRTDRLAPDTRIVILTAKTDPEDAVWCWELGADEYVSKPVDPDKLLREVQMLLKRTPDEVRSRREQGLEDARRLDEMEAAFSERKRRR
jgi:DNA-binding response OmpR family regulator